MKGCVMNITNLIRDNIVKIIKDASYVCASICVGAEIDHTNEKFQAMTNSFDTHLTIWLRNYENETIVSVYPWPTMEGDIDDDNPNGQVTKRSIDKLPVPYYFNQTELQNLLDKMKVYNVPADLDLLNWISKSKETDDLFRMPGGVPSTKVPTAFFKIKYSEGKSFRDCFESIRSVVIGNCLTKRAA